MKIAGNPVKALQVFVAVAWRGLVLFEKGPSHRAHPGHFLRYQNFKKTSKTFEIMSKSH